MNIRYRAFAWLILLAISFSACDESYRPKPMGYYRLDLPEPSYRLYDSIYPYRFEVSHHAQVKEDKTKYTEPNWIDIEYPQFDAEIEITYKPIQQNENLLMGYIEDSRKLVSKHQSKASAIEEYTIKTAQGQDAFFFELSGKVPTQFQFYTTDSTHHFFRGALYFKTSTKNDSLEPVIRFIAKDMVHLMKTFEWKE